MSKGEAPRSARTIRMLIDSLTGEEDVLCPWCKGNDTGELGRR